jgi:hypothetical protein
MIIEYLDTYRDRKDYNIDEIQCMHDHFYHLFMREGTSEYALMILFRDDLTAY